MNKWTASLTLLWLSFALNAGLADESKRPNILWICGDDHAAYVCGVYGNTKVRTPNLDRLAKQGMRFDRAYCNSPVCTASRQSFLTGRYPRTIGVTQLSTPLPEAEVTLAEILRDAGYDTAAIGKMHFNSNLRHGFDLRLDIPQHNQHFRKASKKPIPADIEVLPVWRPMRDPARIWLNGFYRPYGAMEADMAGTYFANEAIKFIQSSRDKPYFLMLSFTEPHSPFHFPVEYRNRHDPTSFQVPKVGPEDDWQIPAIFRDLTENDKQGIIASYYTSVEFLDKNVGLVVDALDKTGQRSNTLVIYTGDHGYMLGHHGRFEKHCCYEPAIHSPLVMSQPNRVPPGTVTRDLVEFIDIAPTVLDWVWLPHPKFMQGRSLRPLIFNERVQHRPHVFIEYAENEEAAIRTADGWKFIYGTGKRRRQDGYDTGRPLPGRTIQLYDLHKDPEELTNLAGLPDQAERVARLTQTLADHMKRTARQPELIPKTDDPHTILAFCLQPRDVR